MAVNWSVIRLLFTGVYSFRSQYQYLDIAVFIISRTSDFSPSFFLLSYDLHQMHLSVFPLLDQTTSAVFSPLGPVLEYVSRFWSEIYVPVGGIPLQIIILLKI